MNSWVRALSHLDAFAISPNVKQALEEPWFGLFTSLVRQEGFLAPSVGSAGKMSHGPLDVLAAGNLGLTISVFSSSPSHGSGSPLLSCQDHP